MKQLIAVLAACLAIAGLSGCNTMRGLGEDISALGRSLSNASGAAGNTQ